jgi:hypothetical protein
MSLWANLLYARARACIWLGVGVEPKGIVTERERREQQMWNERAHSSGLKLSVEATL